MFQTGKQYTHRNFLDVYIDVRGTVERDDLFQLQIHWRNRHYKNILHGYDEIFIKKSDLEHWSEYYEVSSSLERNQPHPLDLSSE